MKLPNRQEDLNASVLILQCSVDADEVSSYVIENKIYSKSMQIWGWTKHFMQNKAPDETDQNEKGGPLQMVHIVNYR